MAEHRHQPTILSADQSSCIRVARDIRQLTALCEKAQAVFLTLLSSEQPTFVLQRKATYYFTLLNEAGHTVEAATLAVAKTAPEEPCEMLTVRLAELALQYYLHFDLNIRPEAQAFRMFSQLFIDRLQPQITEVQALLTRPDLHAELPGILQAYLDRLGQSGADVRHTCCGLFYFERWLSRLSALPLSGLSQEQLLQELLSLNFNFLPLLQCWQKSLQAQGQNQPDSTRLSQLRSVLGVAKTGVHNPMPAFDPCWPSLAHMMVSWLEEEIVLLCTPVPAPGPKKFPLNIPVAQLACLLKLFHEASLVPVTASELIRWAAASLSTKRQPDISSRSLSKEYYSITQFTAARVREILLQAVAKINAYYFP